MDFFCSQKVSIVLGQFNKDTADLTKGFEAICVFVNDFEDDKSLVNEVKPV
jgi:hypothetical protein